MDQTIQLAVVGNGDVVHIPTPVGQSNYNVTFVAPLLAVTIRAAKAFLSTMLGLLSAQMVHPVIPASDFFHLFMTCSALSVSAGVMAALTSSLSLLSRLEEKFPTVGI